MARLAEVSGSVSLVPGCQQTYRHRRNMVLRPSRRSSITIGVAIAAVSCGGKDGTSPSTPSVLTPVSGSHQTGTVGQPLAQPLVVAVTDKSGARVVGVTVSWAIKAGGGALSGTSTQTDAQGQTQVVWTLGTTPGSETDSATASVSGLSGIAVFTASASPGPAAQLTKVSGDGQTGGVGQTLDQPVVVAASDQYGNPTSGVSVAWAITAGGGSVSAASVMTDAQGQASVTWTLGPAAGANNDSTQASVLGGTGPHVTFTASGSNALVYTDSAAFRLATAGLGTPTIVNFEDVDSTPINNSITGRAQFDGSHYAAQGFTFASPGNYPLYIAPGGLFWNASNSLSVGRLPYGSDTVSTGGPDADSLRVTLNPGCAAVSFQLIDIGIGANGTASAADSVKFLDAGGNVVRQVAFPKDYTSYRAFVGLVSKTQVVATILVAEQAHNGDDVDYDDFTCFP